MSNKVFFINSNIFINNKLQFDSLDDILAPLGGNTGNSYITYSLIKEIGCKINDIEHIQNIYTFDFSTQDKYIDIINNECSTVFLILQDQIRVQESYGLKLPYKAIMDFISKLNKPVVIAGLGANSTTGYDKTFYENIDPELINFLKFLSDHCIEIGLRGEYTAEILSKFDIHNTKIIGCPSFYECGRDRIVSAKPNLKKIVFTSENLRTPSMKNVDVVCQDYTDKTILEGLIFDKWDKNIDYHSLDKLKNNKYHIFTNINQWKNFLKEFDFALGCRIHGSIIALNAGIPAICCKNDYRAKEMCEFLHIPYYWKLPKNVDMEKLYKQLDLSKLNNNYPVLYDNYCDFLNKNNIKINPCNKEDNLVQPIVNIDQKQFQKKLNDLLKIKKYSIVEKLFSIQESTTHKIIMFMGIRIRIKK